ncbi:MAG: iron-containing alcohol dehydrogenase [Polyangia bacterium]
MGNSIGGEIPVMDTAKAALTYATHKAPFLRYVNRPIGEGVALPGPLPPHIACPTTSGTGSECTGIAVCSVPLFGTGGRHYRTGLAHRALRPRLALIDPVLYRNPACCMWSQRQVLVAVCRHRIMPAASLFRLPPGPNPRLRDR